MDPGIVSKGTGGKYNDSKSNSYGGKGKTQIVLRGQRWIHKGSSATDIKTKEEHQKDIRDFYSDSGDSCAGSDGPGKGSCADSDGPGKGKGEVTWKKRSTKS